MSDRPTCVVCDQAKRWLYRVNSVDLMCGQCCANKLIDERDENRILRAEVRRLRRQVAFDQITVTDLRTEIKQAKEGGGDERL